MLIDNQGEIAVNVVAENLNGLLVRGNEVN